MKYTEEDNVGNKKNSTWKNNIWKFIKYFVAIFNMIAALASVAGLIISVVTKEKLAIVFYVVTAVIIGSMLLAVYVTIKANRNSAVIEVNKYAKGFHEILHIIRDCYGDLMEVMEDGTYKRPLQFRKYMTEKVMKMMDLLSKNLSDATNDKVRTCIKTFDFIRNGETQIEQMKLITLARSGRQSVNSMIKEHYNPVPLSENTDFEYIFNPNAGYYEEERVPFFMVDDLDKYSKKNEYKNSNKKWRKSYVTTIVMPIRYLSNPGEDEDSAPHYEIIGCLCVDSKKKNLFSIEKRGFVLEYLKGVSDILYIYLNECILYHEYLKEGMVDE